MKPHSRLYLVELMQSTLRLRVLALALASSLLMAAAAGEVLFQAPAPGTDLKPIGGADALIDLVQSQQTVLWSSLAGTVNSYTVLGWPEVKGSIELGGAMVLERPSNGLSGVIDIGDKPMSVEFSLDG